MLDGIAAADRRIRELQALADAKAKAEAEAAAAAAAETNAEAPTETADESKPGEETEHAEAQDDRAEDEAPTSPGVQGEDS